MAGHHNKDVFVSWGGRSHGGILFHPRVLPPFVPVPCFLLDAHLKLHNLGVLPFEKELQRNTKCWNLRDGWFRMQTDVWFIGDDRPAPDFVAEDSGVAPPVSTCRLWEHVFTARSAAWLPGSFAS